MWNMALGIALAVFAVFGLICAVWLLIGCLCGSRIALAVRVFDKASREQLDLLLAEAKDAFGGRRDVVVLLSDEQEPLCAEEIALLQRYDAHLYVV